RRSHTCHHSTTASAHPSRLAKIFQNLLGFCREYVRKMRLTHSLARFTAIRGFNTMSKITLNGFVLLLLLFLGNSSGNYAAASATAKAAKAQFGQTTPESQPARRSLDEGGTGTLQ